MDITEEVKKWTVDNNVALTEPREKVALQFLFDKKVLINDRSRTFKFKSILNPKNAGVEQAKYEKAQNRLFQITNEYGDKSLDNLPDDVMSFEQFCEKVPEWKDPASSYVCFRDDLSMKESLVQRVERSGLCYIHAPVVLQHYLVTKGKNSVEKIGMINISTYIRDQFELNKLEKYIFENDGGSATIILDLILESGSKMSTGSPCLIQFETTLKMYGPHLVSQFMVYEDFEKNGNLIYHGTPSGKCIGRHAMVLVGVRKENEKMKFLLQNWRAKKQFVEVDDEYLTECGAFVSYVQTQQTKIPVHFTTTNFFFAECMDLDQEDVGPLDGSKKLKLSE
jgi:hypothetical protein